MSESIYLQLKTQFIDQVMRPPAAILDIWQETNSSQVHWTWSVFQNTLHIKPYHLINISKSLIKYIAKSKPVFMLPVSCLGFEFDIITKEITNYGRQ